MRRKFSATLREAGIVLDVRNVLTELQDIRTSLGSTWRQIVVLLDDHRKRFKGNMRSFFDKVQHAAAQPNHSLTLSDGIALPIEGWAYFATEDVQLQFNLALDQTGASKPQRAPAWSGLGGKAGLDCVPRIKPSAKLSALSSLGSVGM